MTGALPTSPRPRVYRTSPGWVTFGLLLGVPLAVGGIAGSWFLLTHGNGPWFTRALLSAVILGMPGLLGTCCALSVLRSRVRLFPDLIEVRGLARVHVLTREEILGWKVDPSSIGFVLVPRDSGRRSVKIDSM